MEPFEDIVGWSSQKLFGYLYSHLTRDNAGTIFASQRRIPARDLLKVVSSTGKVGQGDSSLHADSISDLLSWTHEENEEAYEKLCGGITSILGKYLRKEIVEGNQREKKELVFKGVLSLCADYDIPESHDLIWTLLDEGTYRGGDGLRTSLHYSVMQAAFKTSDERNSVDYWNQLFADEPDERFRAVAFQCASRLSPNYGLETAKSLIDLWGAGEFRSEVASSLVSIYFFDLMDVCSEDYMGVATRLRNYWELRLEGDKLGEIWTTLMSMDSTKGILLNDPSEEILTANSANVWKSKSHYLAHCYEKRALESQRTVKQLDLFL
jgi:hypothetical protein